ncbi:mucin-2-like [Scylla paramamosain]|uniref:mucin-2-like n=1 Tax=Scylla paramamosain TaxID=85552 RepID=UPI003082CECD
MALSAIDLETVPPTKPWAPSPSSPTSQPTPSSPTPSHPYHTHSTTYPTTPLSHANSTAPDTTCKAIIYYGQTVYNGHNAFYWKESDQPNTTPVLVTPSHTRIITYGMKSINITCKLPQGINSQQLTVDASDITKLAASGARTLVIQFKTASPDLVSTNYNPLSWQPSDGSQGSPILLDASEVKCVQTLK